MGRFTAGQDRDPNRAAELKEKKRAKRQVRQKALRAAGLDLRARPSTWPPAGSSALGDGPMGADRSEDE